MTIGKTPETVPNKITRDLRRASRGTAATNEFCAKLKIARAKSTYRTSEIVKSALVEPNHFATAFGKLGLPNLKPGKTIAALNANPAHLSHGILRPSGDLTGNSEK